MACTANVLLEVEDIVPHRLIPARPGFEANGVEVQLHVDVRMRQKAGTHADHENKIREILCRGPPAKIYTLEIYPLYGIQLHVYSKPQLCSGWQFGTVEPRLSEHLGSRGRSPDKRMVKPCLDPPT